MGKSEEIDIIPLIEDLVNRLDKELNIKNNNNQNEKENSKKYRCE